MARHEVLSEVTGTVWKITAKPGDQVQAGDTLLILESMKMEIPVEAPTGGKLTELLVKEEDAVDEDQLLAVIEG